MEFEIFERTGEKKSHAKQSRRAGQIPAVIYKKGEVGETILIDEAAFAGFLRNLKPGCLPTTRLTLMADGGKKRSAIIKEIQYHPTTYKVLHLDFLELAEDNFISVKVPLECTGMAECAGVKQGGVFRQVLRYVRVRCLPKDMPTSFTLDVKDLSIMQTRRLKDIVLAKGVRLLDKLEEVAVVVAKR